MSLAIDIDRVAAVLLADGWHEVMDKSFDIDAYEYVQYYANRGQAPHVSHSDGTGAIWKETSDRWISCPISSILAVQTSKD